ncbi:hypothetical protein D3C78_1280410 [compost metagenome]
MLAGQRAEARMRLDARLKRGARLQCMQVARAESLRMATHADLHEAIVGGAGDGVQARCGLGRRSIDCRTDGQQIAGGEVGAAGGHGEAQHHGRLAAALAVALALLQGQAHGAGGGQRRLQAQRGAEPLAELPGPGVQLAAGLTVDALQRQQHLAAALLQGLIDRFGIGAETRELAIAEADDGHR